MNMKGQYHFPTTTGLEPLEASGKLNSGRRDRRVVSSPGASSKWKSFGVDVYASHPFLARNFGGNPSGDTDLATKPPI